MVMPSTGIEKCVNYSSKSLTYALQNITIRHAKLLSESHQDREQNGIANNTVFLTLLDQIAEVMQMVRLRFQLHEDEHRRRVASNSQRRSRQQTRETKSKRYYSSIFRLQLGIVHRSNQVLWLQ